MEPKREPKSIKNRENLEKNEDRNSMRKKEDPRHGEGLCLRAQRQPNINKIPSEKYKERKQPEENLSENKLNELRRNTFGKIQRRSTKRRSAKGEVQKKKSKRRSAR